MAELLLARRLALAADDPADIAAAPAADIAAAPAAHRAAADIAAADIAAAVGVPAGGARGPAGRSTVCVSSAGTRTVDGRPVTPQTAAQLALRGLDAHDFRSRSLTDDMVRRADLVLTATRAHRSQVLERVPLALRRTFTLLEFAALAPGRPAGAGRAEHPGPSGLADLVRRAAVARGTAALADYDVPDPVGGPDEGFAAVADTIERAVDRIAAALLAAQ